MQHKLQLTEVIPSVGAQDTFSVQLLRFMLSTVPFKKIFVYVSVFFFGGSPEEIDPVSKNQNNCHYQSKLTFSRVYLTRTFVLFPSVLSMCISIISKFLKLVTHDFLIMVKKRI